MRTLAIVAAAAALGGGAMGAVATQLVAGGGEAAPASAAATATPAAGVPSASSSSGIDVAAVARRALPGVVSIEARGGGVADGSPLDPLPRGGRAQGSGFVVDAEGHVLTNAHVVDGADSVRVTLADGTEADARIVGVDDSSDLALLKIDVPAEALTPLSLAPSSSVEVGEPVVAIGNPLGYEGSVSAGVVSATGRTIEAPNGYAINGAVQTDAAINHGSSGGPLLDAEGRVIGVNAQIADSGVDGNVGIGFAIPADTAARVLERLRAGEEVSHAWLGVSGQEIDASLREEERVPAERGVLVTGVVAAGLVAGSEAAVVDGAPACLGGDAIVAAGGEAVATVADLQEAVARAGAGSRLPLEVVGADAARRTVEVTLAERPDQPPAPTRGCG